MNDEKFRRADETLEPLTDGLQILQKRRGFRFGQEAVLLAAWAAIAPDAAIADFGTGTGVLPLLLVSRGKGSRLDAIEIAEEMADMAARSVRLNGLEGRIRVLLGDVREAARLLPPGSYDAVVCNPPYRRGTPSPDPLRALAMTMPPEGLSAWWQAAAALLKPDGRLHLVIPPAIEARTARELATAGLHPARRCAVRHAEGKPPVLLLLEAAKAPVPAAREESLVLYGADGRLTGAARSLYRMEKEDGKTACMT